jgi:hypothetical protein
MTSLSELIRAEEAKRDRNWDPQQRWKVLQETIAWVDSLQKVPRNSKEGCLANQQRILAQMAARQARKSVPPIA